MRGLDVHENIEVSDTKLMLGLRVCFISSDLTANKLFLINLRAITGPPKMSLLLDLDARLRTIGLFGKSLTTSNASSVIIEENKNKSCEK